MAQPAQRRRFGRSIVSAAVVVVAVLPTAAGRAQGGDAPPAKDTIFARKTVMDTIGSNMDQLEEMLEPSGKLDVADAREHLDAISVLLQAFPHLFPAATNQWQAGASRDPAYDTFAAPAVWSNFPDFYARAMTGSKAALDASRTTKMVEFKGKVAELRSTCDGCHALYMKAE